MESTPFLYFQLVIQTKLLEILGIDEGNKLETEI